MQIKSRSVEMACIEIINRLVDEVQVSDRDENNKRKFQLPFNENAAADLMRKEELLPIDKYDWINFEKLYKPVNFPIPKVHRKLCKLLYCSLIIAVKLSLFDLFFLQALKIMMD